MVKHSNQNAADTENWMNGFVRKGKRAYNDYEWVREKEKTMELIREFVALKYNFPITATSHIFRVTVVDEVNSAFVKNEKETKIANPIINGIYIIQHKSRRELQIFRLFVAIPLFK